MSDKKEAAEHATIVDLIRNDLSRVAEHVRWINTVILMCSIPIRGIFSRPVLK